MLCQNCGKSEANVKYTQIVNGVKKEMLLCTRCSKELGIGIENMDFNMPINLSSFFGEFLQETEPSFLQEIIPSPKLICDKCHMTYDDFVKTGKLGCSNCYEVFSNKIDPLLKNIHPSSRHVGRKLMVNNKNVVNTNKNNEVSIEKTNKSSEIENLKNKLKIAIQEERYEDAAKIRDEIKKLEK